MNYESEESIFFKVNGSLFDVIITSRGNIILFHYFKYNLSKSPSFFKTSRLGSCLVWSFYHFDCNFKRLNISYILPSSDLDNSFGWSCISIRSIILLKGGTFIQKTICITNLPKSHLYYPFTYLGSIILSIHSLTYFFEHLYSLRTMLSCLV